MPAAAAMPDGAYARFTLPGEAGGLVFVSYTGATTVNAGVLGLMGSTEYELRGSSQDCSHPSTMSNRVFRIRAMTNADGVLWLRRSPSLSSPVHSVWLGFSTGWDPLVCSISFNFDRMVAGGDINGDGALGFYRDRSTGKDSLVLVEKRPNARARTTVVISSLITSYDYAKFVSHVCGHKEGSSFFTVGLDNGTTAEFKSKTIDLTQSELDATRSVRVRDSEGGKWGCVPLSIIAILIG